MPDTFALAEYLLPLGELIALHPNGLAASPGDASLASGLSMATVSASRAKHGPNALSPPKIAAAWRRFLKHLTTPMQLLMIAASTLAWVAFGLTSGESLGYINAVLAGALLVTLLTTAIISFWQEAASSEIARAIHRLLPTVARVRRNCAEVAIPVADITVGDLVHLVMGGRVPADCVLIQGYVNLDLSSITGESDPVRMTPVRRSDALSEARNVAFSSALILTGDAWAVVVRIGDATFIGQTQAAAGAERTVPSTIDAEMKRLGVVIASIAAVAACTFLSIGLARGLGFVFSFVNAFILVLIAVVPEGLPVSITSILSLSAASLAAKNVFVKRAALLEALGSASAILTDKTGTLTVGQMGVSQLWYSGSFTAVGDADTHHISAAMRTGRALSLLSRRALVHSTTATAATHHQHFPTDAASGEVVPPGSHHATVLNELAAVAADRTHADVRERAAATTRAHKSHAEARRLGHHSSTSLRGLTVGPGDLRRMRSDVGGASALGAASGHVLRRSMTAPPIIVLASPTAIAEVADETVDAASTSPTSERDDTSSSGGDVVSASWDSANVLTRLLTIAVVCNAAEFSGRACEDDTAREGAQPPLPTRVGDVSGAWAAVGPRAVLAAPPPDVLMGRRSDSFIQRARSYVANVPPASVRLGTAHTRREVLGDASDAALLRFCDSVVPEGMWRSAYKVVQKTPFDSVTKASSVIVTTPSPGGDRGHLLLVKGAPERIAERCSFYAVDDGGGAVSLCAIDATWHHDFAAAYERFALCGERVLGFAYAPCLPDGTPQEGGELVFAGLISLADPPKDGCTEAVGACRTAGVRVVVVTGDHPLTAESIARKVGIITKRTVHDVAAEDGVAESSIDAIEEDRVRALVLSGFSLAALSDAQWAKVVAKDEVVFARTTPEQKVGIVGRYQAAGHCVVALGDGTNDAPALKMAHVGVSMGSLRASDVAKEAADVVVLDDDFAHIVDLIFTGRLVFANIRKTMAFVLAHGIPELIPVFCEAQGRETRAPQRFEPGPYALPPPLPPPPPLPQASSSSTSPSC